MARTKAQPATRTAPTSRTWVYKLGHGPHRSDDPAAPADWTHCCDEGDGVWTERGESKGVTDGKP